MLGSAYLRGYTAALVKLGWEDKIPGGDGDHLTPADVDARELAHGVTEEKEHTPDRHVRTEIALDHLARDPRYYTHLRAVEKRREKTAQTARLRSLRRRRQAAPALPQGSETAVKTAASNAPENLIRRGLGLYGRQQKIEKELAKEQFYEDRRAEAKKDEAKLALLAAAGP